MSNTKVNITIDADLLRKIDDYCDSYYQTRSGFFAQCAIEKIQSLESLNKLSEISAILEKVSKEEVVDDKTQKEIDSLVFLSNKLIRVAQK